VKAGCHVTEVKADAFSARDCGANPEAWAEMFIQLWDIDEDGLSQMPAGKFSAIIRKVSDHVRLDPAAKLGLLKRHRPLLEAIASEKYDRARSADDRILQIRADDLLTARMGQGGDRSERRDMTPRPVGFMGFPPLTPRLLTFGTRMPHEKVNAHIGRNK